MRLPGFQRAIDALSTVRVLRYALMGSCAALVQLLLLTLFIEVVGLPSLLASTTALLVSILVNYGLQHRVTFRSRAKHSVAGPRFVVLALGTLALNALLFGTLSTVLPYLVSQIVTLGLIFPLNYHLNRMITFRV